jgi:hypothetical protein
MISNEISKLSLPALVLNFNPNDIPLIPIPKLCINNFYITYKEVLNKLRSNKSTVNTIDERIEVFEKAYNAPKADSNVSFHRKIHTPYSQNKPEIPKNNLFKLAKEASNLSTLLPAKGIEFKSKALKLRYREAKKGIANIRSKSVLRKSVCDPSEDKLKSFFSEYVTNQITQIRNDDNYILEELTKNNPLFAQLSKDACKLIAVGASLQSTESDKVVYREGEVANCFYIVVYGRVGFYANNIGNFGFCSFGGCFGHDWVLKQNIKLRTETVFCEKDALLLVYSLEQFEVVRYGLEDASFRNDKLIFYSYIRRNNVEKCLMKEKKFSEVLNG